MPNFEIEDEYKNQNLIVAGLDEAGRGSLAGPVVAAAVIINDQDLEFLEDIDDSKKVSPLLRKKLYDDIVAHAQIGVGIVVVDDIDNMNILNATKIAMRKAYFNLSVAPDVLLVDGNHVPDVPCRAEPVIRGDTLSISIAAASIIAKVVRDNIMANLSMKFPHYLWDRNMGYGTDGHIKAIRENGITAHHRKSFAPIKYMIS